LIDVPKSPELIACIAVIRPNAKPIPADAIIGDPNFPAADATLDGNVEPQNGEFSNGL
jgi:hypothetical protein